MITEDELKSQLREQSVESYEDIKLATLEGDGRFSVLNEIRRKECGWWQPRSCLSTSSRILTA